MHKSLDEFEFLPDTTTNSRVICPCASEKLMYNNAIVFDQIFIFAGKRTSIKSRTSGKFEEIRPWNAELAALDCLEKST